MDKASDFLYRALEAVSSCDCVEGCENCEVPRLALQMAILLTNDGRYH
jgi:hypothetical protein